MYQEAILKLVRPVEQARQERTIEEEEDYDEYMKKHLARVKQHSFRFGRARWTSTTNSNSRDIRTEDNQQVGGGRVTSPHSSGDLLVAAVEDRSQEAATALEETNGRCEETMEVDGGVGMSEKLGSLRRGASESGPSSVAVEDDQLPSAGGDTNNFQNLSLQHHSIEHSYASSSAGAQPTTSERPIAPEGSSFLSPVQKKSMVCTTAAMDETVHEPNSLHQGHLTTHEENGNSSLNFNPRESGGEGSSSMSEEHNRIQTRSSIQRQVLNGIAAAAGQESNENAESSSQDEQQQVQREEQQVNIVDVDETSQDSQNMMSSLIYSLGLTEDETKRCISMWHNRTIVPQLDSAHLSSELARRWQLYNEENENYEIQNNRRALSQVAIVSVIAHNSCMT